MKTEHHNVEDVAKLFDEKKEESSKTEEMW